MKVSCIIGCAMIAFMSISTLALAAAPKEDCGSMPQQAMNECYGRALDRANDQLNVVYSGLIRRMQDDARSVALLRAAERAWVDFREKQCAFQAHGEEGGSLYPTEVATCQIEMTEARTKELREPD